MDIGVRIMIKAKANANIALIKYWGKKDEKLFLPYNSSLSLTLDCLHTITEVSESDEANDIFILDGTRASTQETAKISRFINFFRQDEKHIKVESYNAFPTAAGLASSASGFAALAVALNEYYGLNLDKQELSKITRQGSGSASRSLYGGFAIWQTGDHDSSYAYPLENTLDITMIIVIVNGQQKTVSSRDLMKKTVEESLYFEAWVKQNQQALEAMKKAIDAQDIHLVGQIAERNAMMMHATLLANKEPFFYIEPDSLRIIQAVQSLRHEGYVAYVTMDAGPNVKVITNRQDEEVVLKRLKELFSFEMLVGHAGEGAEIL